MSTVTSPNAEEERFLRDRELKEESVESVFAPLTRLSHSKSEQTAMQPTKHSIIHLLDHTGCILGRRRLSNTTCVIDLESFRSYGVCRVEVLRTTHASLDKTAEWARHGTHKSKRKDSRIAGDAQ
jgi:hypothetical protein